MGSVRRICLAIGVLTVINVGANGLFAATPPEPTYGTAVVDGDTSE